jgi:hypothetical protein
MLLSSAFSYKLLINTEVIHNFFFVKFVQMLREIILNFINCSFNRLILDNWRDHCKKIMNSFRIFGNLCRFYPMNTDRSYSKYYTGIYFWIYFWTLEFTPHWMKKRSIRWNIYSTNKHHHITDDETKITDVHIKKTSQWLLRSKMYSIK